MARRTTQPKTYFYMADVLDPMDCTNVARIIVEIECQEDARYDIRNVASVAINVGISMIRVGKPKKASREMLSEPGCKQIRSNDWAWCAWRKVSREEGEVIREQIKRESEAIIDARLRAERKRIAKIEQMLAN